MIRIIKNEFCANIAKLATGTVAAHVFWLLFMLASARFYTPEYFGEGQLFVSAASVLAVMATGRYEMAIMVPRYRFSAIELLLFSMTVSFLCTFIFLLVILGIGETIALFIGITLRETFLLPAYVLEICLFSLFQSFLVREKLYSVVAKGVVLFPAVAFILCMLFRGADFLHVHKIVLAMVLARFLQVLYYGFFLRVVIKDFLYSVSWRNIFRCGKAYADFPRYMLVGSVVDTMAHHAVPFFLAAFWGKEATGYYSMASHALAAPASLIAHSVGRVFQQETGRLYGKYRECKDFYLKNFRLCLGYSAIVCVSAFALAPTVLPLLLGDNWSMVGHYVQLLLPMTFVTLISSPLSTMFMAARRQRAYLGIQTTKLVGSVLSLIIAGRWVGATIDTTLLAWGCLIAGISGWGIIWGKRIAEGK